MYPEAGALMSYGAGEREQFRVVATYVHRLLKGASPAGLPIEQVARFELVLNLKTARALGLKPAQSLLLRADEVMSERYRPGRGAREVRSGARGG